MKNTKKTEAVYESESVRVTVTRTEEGKYIFSSEALEKVVSRWNTLADHHLSLSDVADSLTEFEVRGRIYLESWITEYVAPGLVVRLTDNEIKDTFNDSLMDLDCIIHDNTPEEINDLFVNPYSAIKAAVYGEYNPNHEFFMEDGYDNLKSLTSEDMRKLASPRVIEAKAEELLDELTEEEEEAFKAMAMYLVKRGY